MGARCFLCDNSLMHQLFYRKRKQQEISLQAELFGELNNKIFKEFAK